MQKIRAWFMPKHRLSTKKTIVVILASSAMITLFLLCLSPLDIVTFLRVMLRGYLLVPLLNWLPVLLTMLLLYFLTANLAGAVSLTGFFFMAMGIVNRVKLALRGDPLLHWDLSLAGEALGVAEGFGWHMEWLIVLMAVWLAATIAIGRRVGGKRLRWLPRLGGMACCLALAMILNKVVYANKAIEAFLPIHGTVFNAADVHASKGNLYAFIHNWNIHRTGKPQGYDTNGTLAFIDAYEQEHPRLEDTPEIRPHIIMVMGEGFSALSQSEAVDFTGYTNPLAHFEALGEEGVTGTLVVPGRGGGTADTEFDVLTARPARYLRGAPYAYRTINAAAEALPSLLAGMGYDAFALHPGYPWFYNRQNVYRLLGFEEAVFADAFAEEAYRDFYISERATFDMLLDMLAARREGAPGVPLFAFCLTIQNHAPYGGRFLPEGTRTFTPREPMTEAWQEELSNYFAAISDADEALMRLADYLDGLDEPAVLVYFGDHLPALDEGLLDLLIPAAAGEPQRFAEETRFHRVPFLIWENSAAREMGAVDTERALLPDDRIISSNYLGAYLLECLGMDGASPFFAFVNELRHTFPVVLDKHAYLAGGIADDAADEEQSALLAMYRYWVHYRTVEEKAR